MLCLVWYDNFLSTFEFKYFWKLWNTKFSDSFAFSFFTNKWKFSFRWIFFVWMSLISRIIRVECSFSYFFFLREEKRSWWNEKEYSFLFFMIWIYFYSFLFPFIWNFIIFEYSLFLLFLSLNFLFLFCWQFTFFDFSKVKKMLLITQFNDNHKNT